MWPHHVASPCCSRRPQKRGCLLGTGTGGGRKTEGSTADTARKRPERPWTAARTMDLLRRCPLAIAAQRLRVHRAVAVSTAVLGGVTRTMSVALLLRNNPKRRKKYTVLKTMFNQRHRLKAAAVFAEAAALNSRKGLTGSTGFELSWPVWTLRYRSAVYYYSSTDSSKMTTVNRSNAWTGAAFH